VGALASSMGVVEMRRVVVVAACVIGLLWVVPVTGAAPAPAPAVATAGLSATTTT
jgi:hypothetical protein